MSRGDEHVVGYQRSTWLGGPSIDGDSTRREPHCGVSPDVGALLTTAYLQLDGVVALAVDSILSDNPLPLDAVVAAVDRVNQRLGAALPFAPQGDYPRDRFPRAA